MAVAQCRDAVTAISFVGGEAARPARTMPSFIHSFFHSFIHSFFFFFSFFFFLGEFNNRLNIVPIQGLLCDQFFVHHRED